MGEETNANLTKYFANEPSLFDEISKPSSKYPDVSHLLEEEVQKSNIPNEVIDYWKSPVQQNSSVPPELTLPGCFTSVDYQDYINEVATVLCGPDSVERRKEMLSEDDVTQDDRGLRHLIVAGCFRSALNLTSRLLSVYGQGFNKMGQVSKNTSHSLGLWFTRLSLLLKLGQYEVCIKETEAFGKLDRPDVFYEHYPDLYGGRKGSMACFTFRLLIAELPVYKGNLSDALNNLTDLLEVCKKIEGKFEKEFKFFWTKRVNRVLHSIVNCSLLMKNYALTTKLLRELVESSTDPSEKSALQLALGRIYLQCGDLVSAEACFNKVFEKNQQKSLAECINRGLLHVAMAEFAAALELFQAGLKLEPKNIMLHNNIAVCYLYTGRLKDAIKQYEDAIDLNPAQALNENFILNISTLYELESNNAKTKKLNLLKKIALYKPDLNCSVDVCLKIDYKKNDEAKSSENRDNYVV